MSEIEWRQIICNELTCYWQDTQPFWFKFAPTKMTAQQSWRLVNMSADELSFDYKFLYHHQFNSYLEQILWLKITQEASTASQVVTHGPMFQLENYPWRINIAASESAVINFQWENRNWHYLVSQKVKNHHFNYDWLIKINRIKEATSTSPLNEESQATNEAVVEHEQNEINTQKESGLIMVTDHQNEQSNHLLVIDKQTVQLEYDEEKVNIGADHSKIKPLTGGSGIKIITDTKETTAGNEKKDNKLMEQLQASTEASIPDVLGVEIKTGLNWWWLIGTLIVIISILLTWWWQWCKSFDFSRLA